MIVYTSESFARIVTELRTKRSDLQNDRGQTRISFEISCCLCLDGLFECSIVREELDLKITNIMTTIIIVIRNFKANF